MSNIFANATRTVKTHTCIQKDLNEFDKISDAVGIGEALRDMKKAEISDMITENVIRKMKNEEKEFAREAVIMNSLTEGKLIKASNKILEECRTELFKYALSEFFINGLWLDKKFINENYDRLTMMVERYIDENGKFNILKEATMKHPDSILLKKMYEACDKTAKKVANRKLTEMKTAKDADEVKVDLTRDEKKEYLDDISKLDTERIGQLVKDKVITVIKDEKKREEKDNEIVTEIEDELKDDKSVKDEKSIDEALSRMVINSSPFEEATLFNALLRNSYEEILKENVAIQSDVQDNYEDRHHDYDYKVNQDIDDFNEDNTIDSVNDDFTLDEYDCKHDETSVEGDEEEINNDLAFENSATVNMDHVFADAIVNYTLMETLYTLKLENYSYDSIKSLTQKIVNPVLETNTVIAPESKEMSILREEFFNIFNKFKNLNEVERTKTTLKKFVDKCNTEESKYVCETCITTGIRQIKDIIEKNPVLKPKYQDIIDWCQEKL